MRVGLLLFAGALLFASCRSKSSFEITPAMLRDIPDTVIQLEEMISLMTDVHLAESYVIEQKTDSIPDDSRLRQYYAQIYATHGVSDAAYKSSFQYYAARPVLMNYIYDRITENLNLLESQNRKQINKKGTTN